MIKNSPGASAGIAVAALGAGYYYYLQKNNREISMQQVKEDAARATGQIPKGDKAEKAGEKTGLETGFEDAVSNPRTSGKPDERIPEYTTDGKSRIGEIREDAANKLNTSVDKVDRTVEQKASEAKGTVKGWFGK
ncbi:hypothetical protein PHISCL_07527 [Aspergillus sclerotialis]|uniref:Calcofluor white hypersensitive protein n=1 Tax=Aspergillus sclerotialis TaxID=2070753 RepID=A0A3A2ZLC4_9EURO|nr:hypothetical protein PHISCL_07527 [Aspergillus sclerotialis]